MARTYLPTLVLFCETIVKYLGRHYAQLCANCTTAQVEAVDALLTCANALIAAIDLQEQD